MITLLLGQEANYLKGSYVLEDKNTGSIRRIEFEREERFQYIVDDRFDCTPAFVLYGKGKYEILEDSIHLVFDFIPSLKSESQLDSIASNDDTINISITLVNDANKLLDDATLRWGNPKRKGRWLTAEFFQQQFDDHTELRLKAKERLNFIRIEKDGYYSHSLDVPKNPSKNYDVDVILRKKPKIEAKYYVSNETLSLKMLSECEIQLNVERVLKKEECK